MNWAGLAVLTATTVVVAVPHWHDTRTDTTALRETTAAAGRRLWRGLTGLAGTVAALLSRT